MKQTQYTTTRTLTTEQRTELYKARAEATRFKRKMPWLIGKGIAKRLRAAKALQATNQIKAAA